MSTSYSFVQSLRKQLSNRETFGDTIESIAKFESRKCSLKSKKEKLLKRFSPSCWCSCRKQGLEESIDETAESNSSKHSDDKQEEEPEPIRSFGERHDSYGRPLAKLASRMFLEAPETRTKTWRSRRNVEDLQDFVI